MFQTTFKMLAASKYISLVSKYFQKATPMALAIIEAESDGRTQAQNIDSSETHGWADSLNFNGRTTYPGISMFVGSFGLFQVGIFAIARKKVADKWVAAYHDPHGRAPLSYKELFDPETNICIAKQIYDEGGWDKWSTYLNKTYENYFPQAQKDYKLFLEKLGVQDIHVSTPKKTPEVAAWVDEDNLLRLYKKLPPSLRAEAKQYLQNKVNKLSDKAREVLGARIMSGSLGNFFDSAQRFVKGGVVFGLLHHLTQNCWDWLVKKLPELADFTFLEAQAESWLMFAVIVFVAFTMKWIYEASLNPKSNIIILTLSRLLASKWRAEAKIIKTGVPPKNVHVFKNGLKD